MPYMIDGHNLIPKVRGLSLQNPDDELELIKQLQTFCRVRRQTVEVYFDKASPGHSGAKSFGLVKAYFVPETSNADTAIRQALKRLERKARNWKVVSSDRQVQAEVRSAHAVVISSEAFAAQLDEALVQAFKSPTGGQGLSAEEVDAWLELFNHDRDETSDR